jgi:hypothetical protein
MAYWLHQYLALPAPQRNATLDAWLGGGDDAAIARALAALYAGTRLGVAERRQAWLAADPAAFAASDDTMIRLAVALMPTLLALEDEDKAAAGASSHLRPLYLAGVQEFRRSRGDQLYPDANGSLRVTYGHVTGYRPRDGLLATPFTTAAGMAAKATGEEPFDAPPQLLAAVRAQRYGRHADAALGGLPVNFLADLDITGGNSGSPVLDARGELAGLVFDGNWEGVSANWVYDGAVNRTIAVDIRYVAWLMEAVFPAPRLLAELGIARTE